MSNTNSLVFEGSNCFRIRLLLSVITGKPLLIKKIRIKDDEPGLHSAELSLLKLIDKITNGSTFEVDDTGTVLTFIPGLLIGGQFEHDCGLERCISYFLEVVCCFAPFCKQPIEATLYGLTNTQIDVSIDSIRHSTIPLMLKVLTVYGKFT